MSEPDVLRDAGVASRVVRGGAQGVAAFVIGNLLVAVASIFLLRHLGVVDFGRYGTVTALALIVLGLADAGLTITATRDLAVLRRGEDRRAVLRVVSGLRLALTAAGVLGAVLFAVLAGYDRDMVLGMVLMGIGVGFVALQSALQLPLAVDMRNDAIAIIEIVKQAVLALGMVALVAVGAGLLPFFTLQILVGLVALALLPRYLGRAGLAAPRIDLVAWRELARRTLPVAIAAVLGIVYFRVLVLMSSLLTDEFENGLFVTSTRVIELLAALPVLLSVIVLPVLSVAAREDPGRLGYVLQRMTEAAAVLGAGIALLLCFAAEPIVLVLGGEEFRDAAPVLRIQGAVMFSLFLVQAWVIALVALERPRELVAASAAGLVAVLAAGAVLIPAFDAQGGAIAALAADAILAAAVLLALRRAGPGRDLAWGWLGKLVLAVAAGLLPLLAPGLPDIVAAAASGLLYAGAALALRLVPPEVIAAIKRR